MLRRDPELAGHAVDHPSVVGFVEMLAVQLDGATDHSLGGVAVEAIGDNVGGLARFGGGARPGAV